MRDLERITIVARIWAQKAQHPSRQERRTPHTPFRISVRKTSIFVLERTMLVRARHPRDHEFRTLVSRAQLPYEQVIL
jgi:hypothetical protein